MLSDSQVEVTGLYWCPAAGDPMLEAHALEVQAERGVVGDRYARGVGAYSDSEPAKPRHLTVITQDGIDAAADWQQAAGLAVFDAPLTRRNVVVTGMSASALNELVGRRFWLGDILCEAVELATPCDRPSALASIDGFQSAFDGRGGLRVRLLDGGVIRVGDRLTLPESA